MELTYDFNPAAWAEKTFCQVALGDKRRTKRAVALATALAHNPGASLPTQTGSFGQLKAAYRLLNEEDVTHSALLTPHYEQTFSLAKGLNTVLMVQDTTELDYTFHRTTTGLGPIGNGGGRGFLLQNVLAIDPPTGQVLGLAYQEPFIRKEVAVRQSCNLRKKRERESQVWVRTVREIGPPPPNCTWVHVGDRYSDFFEFLEECKAQNCQFVIRAAQDRRVKDEADNIEHLFNFIQVQPSRDEQVLELASKHGKPARTAKLSLSFSKLTLLPPRHSPKKAPLAIWVVRVWEQEPPVGEEALEWVLLSSVEVSSIGEGWERVAWYRKRWVVEEYHQCLKTGCSIEQRQLASGAGLIRLLGLLAPLAVRLLQLRQIARQNPDLRASAVVPQEMLNLVVTLSGQSSLEMSLDYFWREVARQGGYLGRKRDGPPGWKSLWRGWLHLQTLLEGVRLAPRLSPPKCG